MKNTLYLLKITILMITMKVTLADTIQEIIPGQPKVFNLQELIGNSLTDTRGKTIDTSILKGKWIGLYFAKGGNKTCEEFTRKLVELRNKHADSFEVVYISGDSDQATMLNSIKELPWPALPFDSEKKSECKASFNINNIPSLVILDPLGYLPFSANTKKENGVIYTKEDLDEWIKIFNTSEYNFSNYFQQPLYIGDGIEPPKDLTIDPGASIFGCSYGSTEKQVIEKLGSPLGKYSDKEGSSTLFYGKDCALFFDNGQLCGIKTGQLDNDDFLTIYDDLDPNLIFASAIEDGGWKLANGVHHMMNLTEAQKLCGFECKDQACKINWEHKGQIITFGIKEENNVKLIENIMVMPKGDKENTAGYISPFNIPCIPSKSIYGCDLGLSQNEVIRRLGNPIAQLNLGKNKSGLVYNQKRSLLLFWNNKLGGGIFKGIIIQGPLGSELNPNYPFSNLSCFRKSTNEVLPFILRNGIGCGQPIAYAQGILGDKLKKLVNSDFNVYQYIYKDGPSAVILEHSDPSLNEGLFLDEDPIFYQNTGSFDDDFKPLVSNEIHTIKITPISEFLFKK